MLKASGLKEDIVVDTVERYQGSEKDIIIMSCALSRKEELIYKPQTYDNKVDRKLNVAVSRAKEQFILCGDKALLNCSTHYSQLLSKLKHEIVEADSY